VAGYFKFALLRAFKLCSASGVTGTVLAPLAVNWIPGLALAPGRTLRVTFPLLVHTMPLSSLPQDVEVNQAAYLRIVQPDGFFP
jgi:hypothetical protein